MDIIQERWFSVSDAEIVDIGSKSLEYLSNTISRQVEEILDIYTEEEMGNGKILYRKIGEMERSIVHKTGQLHATGHVWIYNSTGQVFLQKRSQFVETSKGLLDTSSSGHIISGLSITEGTLLELYQEIGLNISAGELKHIGNYRREIRNITLDGLRHNNEINKIFLLKYNGPISSFRPDKKEISEFVPIHITELERQWNNNDILPLYTYKFQEYRKMVLQNIIHLLG